MIARFSTLFSLSVNHDYYGGVSQDFDFVVPAETQRLFGRGRLLARTREGVLYVLYQGDDTRTPRASIAGETLRFGLKLNDPFLLNVTAPSLPVAPMVSFYRNATAPGSLDAAEARILSGNILSDALALTTRPVTVTLRDKNGTVLRTETVTAEPDRPAVSFEVSAVPPGPCSVDQDYGAGGVETTFYVLGPELQSAGVSAVVDIAVPPAFYSAPASFAITLGARQETLKYYVVAKNYSASEFSSLSVADAGSGDPDDPRLPIGFDRVADSAFGSDDIPASLLTLDGGSVVLFKSQALVARRARGRKKIRLNKNGEVLIENLPQLPATKSDANIILHISK